MYQSDYSCSSEEDSEETITTDFGDEGDDEMSERSVGGATIDSSGNHTQKEDDDFGSGHHYTQNSFEPFDSDLAYYGLMNQEDDELIIGDNDDELIIGDDDDYNDAGSGRRMMDGGGIHHLRDIYVRTAAGDLISEEDEDEKMKYYKLESSQESISCKGGAGDEFVDEVDFGGLMMLSKMARATDIFRTEQEQKMEEKMELAASGEDYHVDRQLLRAIANTYTTELNFADDNSDGVEEWDDEAFSLEQAIYHDLASMRHSIEDNGAVFDFITKEDKLTEDWDKEINTFEAFLNLRRHFTIRESMIRILHPLPTKMKKVGWINAILIIITGLFVILTYGLSLANEVYIEIDPFLAAIQNQCPNSVGVEDVKNYDASKEYTIHWTQNAPLLPGWSLPSDYSKTDRWLIANALAIGQSVFFSEPFILFVRSIITVAFLPFISSLYIYLTIKWQQCVSGQITRQKSNTISRAHVADFFEGNLQNYKILGGDFETTNNYRRDKEEPIEDFFGSELTFENLKPVAPKTPRNIKHVKQEKRQMKKSQSKLFLPDVTTPEHSPAEEIEMARVPSDHEEHQALLNPKKSPLHRFSGFL